MEKGFYIIGTDTDVGKTFISKKAIQYFMEKGKTVDYYKPVISDIKNCSEQEIFKAFGKSPEEMTTYTFEEPVSPQLAATINNVTITVEDVKRDYEKRLDGTEILIVEGAGGVICPIYEGNRALGEKDIMQVDLIKEINLPTILVCHSGLGTINHTVLTMEYLRAKEIQVAGIVMNNFDETNFLHIDNKLQLSKIITKCPPIYTMISY